MAFDQITLKQFLKSLEDAKAGEAQDLKYVLEELLESVRRLYQEDTERQHDDTLKKHQINPCSEIDVFLHYSSKRGRLL
jgi:hypothetical protein